MVVTIHLKMDQFPILHIKIKINSEVKINYFDRSPPLPSGENRYTIPKFASDWLKNEGGS